MPPARLTSAEATGAAQRETRQVARATRMARALTGLDAIGVSEIWRRQRTGYRYSGVIRGLPFGVRGQGGMDLQCA